MREGQPRERTAEEAEVLRVKYRIKKPNPPTSFSSRTPLCASSPPVWLETLMETRWGWGPSFTTKPWRSVHVGSGSDRGWRPWALVVLRPG